MDYGKKNVWNPEQKNNYPHLRPCRSWVPSPSWFQHRFPRTWSVPPEEWVEHTVAVGSRCSSSFEFGELLLHSEAQETSSPDTSIKTAGIAWYCYIDSPNVSAAFFLGRHVHIRNLWTRILESYFLSSGWPGTPNGRCKKDQQSSFDITTGTL